MQEIHGKKSLSVQLLKIMLRLRTLIIISDKDLIGVDSHPFCSPFHATINGRCRLSAAGQPTNQKIVFNQQVNNITRFFLKVLKAIILKSTLLKFLEFSRILIKVVTLSTIPRIGRIVGLPSHTCLIKR
jgi:hypothetical protein